MAGSADVPLFWLACRKFRCHFSQHHIAGCVFAPPYHGTRPVMYLHEGEEIDRADFGGGAMEDIHFGGPDMNGDMGGFGADVENLDVDMNEDLPPEHEVCEYRVVAVTYTLDAVSMTAGGSFSQ